ncbi:MAG: TerC family protein [Planctomycetaceae bacterium]
MSLEYLVSILQIIAIDIVLSGDNAVVIAMAAHKLPAYQRRRAIMWGGGIAIFLRIAFTLVMAFLLMIPGVRLVGGVVLTWIACKLLIEEEEHMVTPDDADRSALAAIRTIFVADFVMSLDNMLAVAGASEGDWPRLLFGLMVSIAIIMTCSAFIARLMNRFKWIVYVGAAILALTAAEMMLGDREVASFIVHRHHVSLNSHWEENFLFSRANLTGLDSIETLPDEWRDLVQFDGRRLTFIGQMDEAQRAAIQERVADSRDAAAIATLYEQTRRQPVPDWVPERFRGVAEQWFQRKWPADDWRLIKGHQHHYLAWLFYALVIALCLSSPYWMRGRRSEPEAESQTVSPG